MTDMETQSAEQKRAYARALQDWNDSALQSLAREGVQVQHDSLTSVRLAVLQELLLDEEQLAEYELRCQTKFKAMIEDVRVQINRQKLLAGVNGANVNP